MVFRPRALKPLNLSFCKLVLSQSINLPGRVSLPYVPEILPTSVDHVKVSNFYRHANLLRLMSSEAYECPTAFDRKHDPDRPVTNQGSSYTRVGGSNCRGKYAPVTIIGFHQIESTRTTVAVQTEESSDNEAEGTSAFLL